MKTKIQFAELQNMTSKEVKALVKMTTKAARAQLKNPRAIVRSLFESEDTPACVLAALAAKSGKKVNGAFVFDPKKFEEFRKQILAEYPQINGVYVKSIAAADESTLDFDAVYFGLVAVDSEDFSFAGMKKPDLYKSKEGKLYPYKNVNTKKYMYKEFQDDGKTYLAKSVDGVSTTSKHFYAKSDAFDTGKLFSIIYDLLGVSAVIKAIQKKEAAEKRAAKKAAAAAATDAAKAGTPSSGLKVGRMQQQNENVQNAIANMIDGKDSPAA